MSQINTATVENLVAKEKVLREKKKQLKALQADREWEAKTKARNLAYKVGSLRRPTAADEEALGHVHGWVCSIECQACGKERVINKQDAFQSSGNLHAVACGALDRT